MSCGVGCKHGSDPVLLWFWRRPVATPPISPLAWEPPYATGFGPRKTQKRPKKKKKDANKLICRTETDSHILKTNLWLSKGTGGGERNGLEIWDWHMHTEVYGMIAQWVIIV